MKPAKKVNLTIDNMAYGPYGLGRADDMVIFFPYVISGEKISGEITQQKKKFAYGKITKIIKSSEDRVEPPCPVYGTCGGCHYQHISYKRQVSIKQEIIKSNFSRIAEADGTEILPIVASPENINYRNRAGLKVKRKKTGYTIGFFKTGSHEIVEVNNCILLDPEINKAIASLTNCLKNKSLLKLGIIELDLRLSTVTGQVLLGMVVLNYHKRELEEINKYLKTNSNISDIVVYKSKKRVSDTKNHFNESVNDVELQISSKSFSQINWPLNKKMIDRVLDFANLQGNERILDLYSGIGNFSLQLAKKANKVTGIENSVDSFNDSVLNAELNNVDNCKFINMDALKGVEKLILNKNQKFDLIVLNPPRTGSEKDLLKKLSSFSPSKIIYISCDPATLIRDIKILNENGFKLIKLQAFDMFPQTFHMENIAYMEV